MKKHHRVLLLITSLLLIMLAGFALATEEATTIVADDTHMYLAVGKGDALKLTITPRDAHRAGVTYAISDESIATVDRRGNVKGVALGECVLTITSKYDESVKLEVPVSIVKQVKKIKAELSADSIYVGKTAQITCSYDPEEADLHSATYSSSRESVATVDENGVITGVARGQATINIRSLDGYARTQVRVRVKQQPTSVTIEPETLRVAVGKRGTLKATVLPKDTDNKAVTWTSSDESIATVDKNGRVTSVAPGMATITATCVDDPSVTASVQVEEVLLAKSISFTEKVFPVIIGQTAQLSYIVGPEETSHKDVTFKVNDKRIATVDENGVITGVKGGKTTVTVTTADGSKRSARATIEVIVPVTGVTYKHSDVRVGAGSHSYLTAEILPKEATDKRMTWTSSDESIATVTGTNNKCKIRGRKWGRCRITGTTEDGGYSVTINVNIGSLRHAVVIRSVEIRNGRPYITLQNKSNMVITNVYYEITGVNAALEPVRMSTRGDGYTLKGDYEHVLQPMEKTHHGNFNFYHHSNYEGMVGISMAITGWESDTGYYNNDGQIEHSYTISRKSYEWVSWSQPGVVY